MTSSTRLGLLFVSLCLAACGAQVTSDRTGSGGDAGTGGDAKGTAGNDSNGNGAGGDTGAAGNDIGHDTGGGGTNVVTCSPSAPCDQGFFCDYDDDRCGQGEKTGVCRPGP